jgi:hypothetical protein
LPAGAGVFEVKAGATHNCHGPLVTERTFAAGLEDSKKCPFALWTVIGCF